MPELFVASLVLLVATAVGSLLPGMEPPEVPDRAPLSSMVDAFVTPQTKQAEIDLLSAQLGPQDLSSILRSHEPALPTQAAASTTSDPVLSFFLPGPLASPASPEPTP